MTVEPMTLEQEINAPAAYFEGEKLIVRASSVGRAGHVLAAAIAQVTPIAHSQRTQEIMNEGHLHEPDILERLVLDIRDNHRPLQASGVSGVPLVNLNSDDHWSIAAAGANQAAVDFEISRTPHIVVRCHPDAIVTRNGKAEYVAEAKAMSKDVYEKWLRVGFKSNYAYACQFTIEMVGTGLPGIFAVKNRNNGEMTWQAHIDTPVPLSEIRERLLRIWASARRGDLNPFPDEKCDLYPCPFYFLHPAKPEVMTQEDDVIDGLAALLDEARGRKKQAEALERDAREKIMLALGDRERVKTVRYKVTKVRTERRTLDREKLSEVVDLSVYEKVTASEWVRVDAVKGAEANEH